MYLTKDWIATDDADWAVAIEIIDASTGDPMDISAATFDFAISECGSSVLTASSDDATITKPTDTSIQWVFTAAQMGSLCPGTTYDVGLKMTTAGGTTQLIVGTLAIVDGGF